MLVDLRIFWRAGRSCFRGSGISVGLRLTEKIWFEIAPEDVIRLETLTLEISKVFHFTVQNKSYL